VLANSRRDWHQFRSNGWWGYISKDGKFVIRPQFEGIVAYSDDVDHSVRSDADQFGAQRRRALSV